MDELTALKTPYLFIIDFEKSNPLIIKLSDLDDPSPLVRYRFPKISNVHDLDQPSNTGDQQSQRFFESSPISFDAYSQKLDQAQSLMRQLKVDVINLTIPTPIELTNPDLNVIFNAAQAKYKVLLKDKFVCCSPEIFVRITADGLISTYPMKGTIDANIPNAEEQILQSGKEQREHQTTVNLVMEELSEVADQVETLRFRYLDRLTTSNKDLFQVSSEVVGRLKPQYRSSFGELFDKLLPAGSILGSPRNKALEVIQSSEGYSRGYYTGICGVFDGQSLDSCVLIRIIEKEGEQYFYKSGGGITLDSTAKSEYEEIKNKIYVPVD